jgi:rhamnosyltransferase subunit B
MWDKNVAAPVNEVRAMCKLGPVARILTRYGNSPSRVIGLWPDFFAPVAADWPGQARLAGFPFYDGEDVYPIDPKLEQFLGKGEAPICVSLGTANVHGAEDYASAIRSISRLGQRGLFLTRHPQQLPELPEGVMHFDYAPFSKVLPRCKAIVHHGGVGTTAQSIGAGCPQLVLPMTHDQPDNGNRVEKLGIGRALGTGVSAKRLEEELRYILHHPSMRMKAEELAKRAREQDGLKNAADWVEEMVK